MIHLRVHDDSGDYSRVYNVKYMTKQIRTLPLFCFCTLVAVDSSAAAIFKNKCLPHNLTRWSLPQFKSASVQSAQLK